MKIEELNEQFAIKDVAEFAEGAGGLTCVSIQAADAQALVYLHGAHLASFTPAGGEDVLWVSRKSWFEPGKPIRGGVPVCWPWFGMSDHVEGAPNHGFARLMEWDVQEIEQDGGNVVLTLVLRPSDETRKWFDGEFELRHRVTVGESLTMTLQTRNTGDKAFTVTEALHSYFNVSDVRKVTVSGLKDAEYLDETAQFSRRRQEGDIIMFVGETDRAYVNTTADCVVDDPGMARAITVSKSGSASTVVWNPWDMKAAAMPDYDDNEWDGMVCVETVNVADNAVTIPPGDVHVMQARISVR